MKILKFSILTLFLMGSTATIVRSQDNSPAKSQAEQGKTMATIANAFGSMNLKNIPPTDRDIKIQFPATSTQTQPTTTVIPKGSSWSQLPIGVFAGMGNGKNESMATLAQKIYTNSPQVQTAVNGALANFKFLDKVPVKEIVTAFPQLGKVPVKSEQAGSWGACGAGASPTFGSIAATDCGTKPIPADVRAAMPIAQTGMQNIPYGDLATKLKVQDSPTSNFPLAADISFDKILLPPSTNFTSANLMKVDHLETEIPGQGGKKIRGINSISGSNRSPNTTCKEQKCDYTILQNIVAGSANPLNRNLAIQIHQQGQTTWVDGGIGTIGKTLWNFKEPPGVAPAFDSDRFKLVLEQGNAKTGTVEQKLYLAFCSTIAFEQNCSSKFIGPIPLPFRVSEKNKLALLPMKVDLPPIAAAPTVPNVPTAPTLPTMVPTKQSSSSSGSPSNNASTVGMAPVTTDTSKAYQKLFGSNTLASYSPVSNISNLSN
jgi:hypothetical protein